MSEPVSEPSPASGPTPRIPAVCGDIARGRYPDAELVLLAGSVARDEATPASDLDLVVVYERLEAARRESFEAGGWPVEAFVHDPETIAHFVAETDRRSGTPALAAMIREGVLVAGSEALRAKLEAFAAAEIERGPAPWTPEEIESSRYAITDLLGDLEGGGPRAELTATGVELHRTLARHLFGTRRLWIPKGKHLPRELERLPGELASRFSSAFDDLFGRGSVAAAIALADAVLADTGGRRFAGFSRRAPPEWRRPSPAGRPEGAAGARARVLVIGGASHDAIAHLACDGGGAAASVSHWYPSIGGTGAGKAMNLSALGLEATLHAVLGADRAGEAVAARLAEAGVSLIAHRGERDTQRHTNLMLPDGGRLSLPVEPPERPASFDPDELSRAMTDADVIVPNVLDYARTCLAPARATGTPVWIDIHDYDGHASHHLDFIDAADVLFVSAERLAEPLAFMERMIDAGRRLVVCTRGAAGSIALSADGDRVERAAAPGVAVVDTNGAGDAYMAGFLLGWLEDRTLAQCMGYGTAAAALCVAHRGLCAPGLDAARVRAMAATLPVARRTGPTTPSALGSA